MKNVLKRHKIAFLVSAVVGLITVAPTILAPLELHGGYKGILFAPLNDENVYRGIVHEILDGHLFPSSPFVSEYKNAPVVIAPFSYWLYAFPAAIIGLSNAIILSKFLFPALLFLLIYMLTRTLLESSGVERDAVLTGVAAGLLVTLGYEFINYSYLIPALLGHTPPIPPVWTRPINPIVGALEVFALLWLVSRRWLGYHRLPPIVAAGAFLALSVSYYFSFGISLAVLGSLGVIALVRKEYAMLRDLVYVVCVGVLIDAWYWWNVLSSLSGDPSAAERNGMFYTHAPHVNVFLLLSTVTTGGFFLYSYVWNKQREQVKEWTFIAALLLASWIAFNEQVLTGREIWYFHFVQYTIPLSMVSILVAAHLALPPGIKRLWRAALYVLCAAVIAYGIFSVTSYRSHTEDFVTEQSAAPALSYFEAHAARDCAVYVDVPGGNYSIDLLIPAYTQCNVYNPPPSEFVPSERILHNYFLRLKIEGVRPGQLREYLLAHEADVRGTFFENWLQQTPTGQDAWFLSTVDRLLALYPAFYADDLSSQLKKYRLDYFITQGPASPSLLAQLPFLQLRVQAGDYFIYAAPGVN